MNCIARHFRPFAFCAAAFVVAACVGDPARAQDASDQEYLFQLTLRNPRDIETTFAFVRVATERADYEAAIGALERIAFYRPDEARVKYELATLYARMGSFDMARRYYREALANPRLDSATRARIEIALPDAEKQLQPSRFAVFLQTGLRYQTNPSFSPSAGLVRLGGQDLALLPTDRRRGDTNWFGLAGVSHDLDLNGRGDVLETRFSGYVTEQFKLDQYNVGLFDISVGPRFMLAPEWLPGATIKPYVTGGNIWLGGNSYLSTGGAGISIRVPFNERFAIGPDFEWRRADVNNRDIIPISTINSGDWFTYGITANGLITSNIRYEARALYRRADTQFNFQSYDQFAGEAALTFRFASPFAFVSRDWSISPFARYIRTEFDAANPLIDATIVRRDSEWIGGAVLDAPITGVFGFSGLVQYNHVSSTLPNYRQNNFTVMGGPTARF